MFARAILPLAVVFLLGADEPGKDAKKELEKLQGEWKVVSVDFRGKKYDADAIKQLEPLMVKGNEWIGGLGGKLKRTIKRIDPAKNPKELDLVFDAKGKEATVRGIYKIEGDTLTFCRSAAGTGERPKEFNPGEDLVLLVFKRSGK